MAELKPCPFCGGEAETHACMMLENEAVRAVFSGKYGVHCSVCHVATIPYTSEAEAIEAWNRRAEDGK